MNHPRNEKKINEVHGVVKDACMFSAASRTDKLSEGKIFYGGVQDDVAD